MTKAYAQIWAKMDRILTFFRVDRKLATFQERILSAGVVSFAGRISVVKNTATTHEMLQSCTSTKNGSRLEKC